MNGLVGWFREVWRVWDRFWFTPAQPHTLCLLRILSGGMLFYTHLVWTLNLNDFLGPDAWLPRDVSRELQSPTFVWTPYWYFDSPALIWTLHLVALTAMALLVVGLWTRWAAIVSCLFTLAYCHRLQGALFGLDQVNAMMAMYLAVGPSGAVYSLDHWRKRGGAGRGVRASVGANIAIRLMQLHMCVIYLFGGLSKLQGEMWWDGSAMWFAIANIEYQSLDVTWLVRWPWLLALLTHVTVFWETFYCFTVWPKLGRPVTLLMAVCVHGGIAIGLGMITFGLAMIFGNLSFLRPQTVDTLMRRCFSGLARAHAS